MAKEKSPQNPSKARQNTPKKTQTQARQASPSSPEVSFSWARFVVEIRWIFYGLFGVMLALALFTYSPRDPGFFSTAGTQHALHNLLGFFGAYIASFFYYFFGFSAWILVLLFLQRFFIAIWQRAHGFFHRKDENPPEPPHFRVWRSALGFTLLLVGGLIFDAFNLIHWAHYLPEARPGGILGNMLAFHLEHYFGFLPTNLLGVLCLFFGVSLFFYFSWLDVCEKIGKVLGAIYQKLKLMHQASKDRRVGRQARQARQAREQEAKQQAQAAVQQAQEQTVWTHPQEGTWSQTVVNGDVDQGAIPTATPLHSSVHEDPRQGEMPLSFSAFSAGVGEGRAVGIPTYQDPPAQGVPAPEIPEVPTVGVPALDELPLDYVPGEPPPMPSLPTSMQSARQTSHGAGVTQPATQPAVAQVPTAAPVSTTPPVALPVATTPTRTVHVQKNQNHVDPSPRASEQTMASRQGALFQEDNTKTYPMPGLDLLEKPVYQNNQITVETIEYNSRRIEENLKDFNVEVKVPNAYTGPVITCYELQPAPGVKGSQIINLSKDLARSLSVTSVRILETIEGKSVMGLELPNPKRQTVFLSEIISSKPFLESRDNLPFVVGKDTTGHPVVADLAKMPHLLVAGATGSGKSVGINALLMSFLFKKRPEDLRLILIDPKMLEMSMYDQIPHLLTPVITDMKYVVNALNWCVEEMERRYKLMSMVKVRSILGFNQKVKEAIRQGNPLIDPMSEDLETPQTLSPMPYIVVVIDELADLLLSEPASSRAIETSIVRLAQKARAAGLHLVLATQRPVTKVVTGLIKSNVPGRIAFRVNTQVDSRVILDEGGAENLLGNGDMLLLRPGALAPQRCHGAFVRDEEVARVTEYLRQQCGQPHYLEEIVADRVSEDEEGFSDADDMPYDARYDEALSIVMKMGKTPSVSGLQRRMGIGYNRAANIFEQMERDGILSPMNPHNKTRELLIKTSPAVEALEAHEQEGETLDD